METDDGKENSDALFFKAVGNFGFWQKMIFAVVFYSNIVGIWQNFAMTFSAPNTPYRCTKWSNNDTDMWNTNGASEWTTNQCIRVIYPSSGSEGESVKIVKCIKWKYNETEETLTSKFDLVCEREWLISLSKSIYMIGFMVTALSTGFISDCLGRYVTIVFCYILTTTSVFLALTAESMTTFLIYRFLQAFGRMGYVTPSYILLLEIVGAEYRGSVGILIQVASSFGLLLLSLIGYLFRHWFWFELALAVPLLPLMFCFRIIPESPRWLMLHQKADKLEKLIEVAAHRNGQTPPKDGLAQDMINVHLNEKSQEKSTTLVDVFRRTRMRRRIFNLVYCWAVNAFIYYGLSYNTNDFGGDPKINFMLSALLELPAFGVLYISLRYFGRRFIMMAFMLGSSLACGALLILPGSDGLTLGVSLFGKFCVTASFSLVFLYTGELFPTIARNASFGCCSTVGRIGAIVAPFVREVARNTNDTVPYMIYFMLSFSSGILVYWLPETKGQKLPDTLDEGENFELDVTQKNSNKEFASRKQSRRWCLC